MKKNIIIAFLCLSYLFPANAQQMPELNQKIVDYVKTQIGNKVNRGECWDLAYEALTQNNCEWDGKYNFGRKLNPKTDSIYAGDILQFNNVTLKYIKEGLLYKEAFKHHTAIIYSVKGKDYFEIAHQNNGFSGRKVGISELKLSNKISGTITFFRPVPKSNR
jgi:hypothetical protein